MKNKTRKNALNARLKEQSNGSKACAHCHISRNKQKGTFCNFIINRAQLHDKNKAKVLHLISILKQKPTSSKGLSTRAAVVMILALLVLSALAWFFVSTLPSPDPLLTFQSGCFNYCPQIKERAAAANVSISHAAVGLALELEAANSKFISACRQLWPDVVYAWECWNRDCCK